MDKRTKAIVVLVGAFVVGAVASRVVKHEAAILGFSVAEVGLLGLAIGGVVARAIPGQ